MTQELEGAVSGWMREFDRALSLVGRRRRRIDNELRGHFEDLLVSVEGMPADYAAAMVAEACGDPIEAAGRFDRQAQGSRAVAALLAAVAAFVALAGVWMSSLFLFPRSPWPNDRPPPNVARWVTPGYLAWWLGLVLVVALLTVLRRRLLVERTLTLWPARLVALMAAGALVAHIVFGAVFAFARDRDVSASAHSTTVAAMTGARTIVALAAIYLLARAVVALEAHDITT